jgi:hypothetical protein
MTEQSKLSLILGYVLMGKNKVFATCHPDQKHFARGFCDVCYDKWYAKTHRKDVNRRSREWSKANPSKITAAKIKYNYGISSEQLEAMKIKQNDLCAICKQNIKLHVDHSHNTGVFRGLLCGSCNRGIGLFKENTEWLQSAIEYLNSTK